MRHKNEKLYKIIKIKIILFLIVIFSIINPSSVNADEAKIVKVGFPIIKGFTEKTEEGYTGYAYEYLREIAIYTNWEYEFIEKSLSELMDDLRNGDIDILAGMIKNEETIKIFDFPKYDVGNSYTTLSVSKNSSLHEAECIMLDGLRVGYLEKAQGSLDNFIDFCKENNINNVNLIPYSNSNGREFLVDEMNNGKVDAIIGGDLSISDDERVIAKFGGNPHYFATTKGNSEVIDELNKAIYKIKEHNPKFDKNLYNKYFDYNHQNPLILNNDEAEYINRMTPIRAVYIDNLMPVQYYDESTNEHKGILVDTIKLISQRSGIKFDFIRVKSYDEAYEMIKNNETDIIIGALNDYTIADKHDFLLTKAYLKMDLFKVVNKKKLNSEEKEIVAVPIGNAPIGITGNYEIKYYDTIEDCLKAVNEGEATTTYGSGYSISNYSAVGFYNNITVTYTRNENEVAMGISKTMDIYKRDILNKVVYNLSDKDLEDITQRNTLNIEHSISLKDFFYTNLKLCLCIIGIVVFIVSSLIYIIVKMRFERIKEDKQKLFEKTQTDPLTGAYNREACEKLTMKYLKEKENSLYYAFIIIDIDYFKQINDCLGHKIGDNLLIDFSKILKKSFCNKAIISRLGGDEFIIFLKDIEESHIKRVEEKLKNLCKVMDRKVEYNNNSKPISLSLGCVMSKRSINYSKLYTMADEVLYEVKRNGRNGYKIRIIE